MRYKTLLVVTLFIVFAIGATFLIKSATPAAADSNGNISGYAWSSNIGWISFEGSASDSSLSSYSVAMNLGTDGIGIFSSNSYAWSSNIGWIKFDSSLIGPVSPTDGVRLEIDGRVTGWARACAVFMSGCAGGLKGPSYLGGWDGWIRMDATGNATNDVHIIGNEFRGYAWGSDVIGWIDFCPTTGTSACVTVDSIPASCSGTPNPVEKSQPVVWSGSANLAGNYNYNWSWSGGVTGFIETDTGAFPLAKTYNTPQTITGTLTVTDQNDPTKKGTTVCTVEVQDSSQKTLNVYLVGDGVSFGAGVVDGSGLLTGCAGGGTFCTHNYGVGSTVTLTRSPDPIPNANIASFSWSTNPPGLCSGSDLTCVLTMNQNVDVYASFVEVGGSPSVDLSADASAVKISFQNAGVPSDSTVATISFTNNNDYTVRVCLVSVKSKINSQSLDDVINTYSGPAGASSEGPKCHLEDTGNTQCNSGQNCANVNSGESASIPFFITIADKFYEILKYSPYDVTIEARNGNDIIGLPLHLEFRYQVPDLHPR